MTNRLAIWITVLLLGALAYDLTFNNGETILMLARKFAELIEWLAFWR